MKNKAVIILSVITAVAVLGATAVLLRDQRAADPQDHAVLYPKLKEQLEDVRTLVISDKSRRVTLVRKGEAGAGDSAPHRLRWHVADAHDYPSDQAVVTRLLNGLKRLTVIEPKTENPALYGRLGVNDPDSADSRARKVMLQDGKGDTILALIVGDKVASNMPGGANYGANRFYVRRDGDAQSYLVEGLPEIEAKLSAWWEDQLVDVDPLRIREVRVRHKSGETLRLYRDSQDAKDFTIAGLAKTRKVKSVGGPEATVSALKFLTFEDVRPAAKMDGADAIAEYETFDGLKVTATFSGQWVHIVASYDASVLEGEGTKIYEAVPPDVEGDARIIIERLAPWDYRLADYKVKELAPRLADLLEETSGKAP